MKAILKAVLISLSCVMLHAQENVTVSGHIRDLSSGEELLYANVIVEGTTIGATTNVYGFYSLTLPAGTHKLDFSYIGYTSKVVEIDASTDQTLNVELSADVQTLTEVVLTDKADNENVASTEISTIELNMREIRKMPVLLGEQDLIKTMQLLPGVSSSGEGSSGFHVRGGNTDQNLLLLDEAPVYNASHLFGFFSVFNSDALKDSKIYKGGIPARYGGRLSSVVDIRMKEGNMKTWGVSGGIGLISSRLTVEAPFEVDKGSFILSGRRTYATDVAKLFSDDLSGNDLFFYDLTMKANYRLGDSDRIFLSGYFGRDVLKQGDSFSLSWGNVTGTLRWNHIFTPKLFSNISLIFSDYTYQFGLDIGGGITYSSGIDNITFKPAFSYFLDTDNTIEFGTEATYYIFDPGSVERDSDVEGVNPFNATTVPKRTTLETGTYVSHLLSFDFLKVNYGVRFSSMSLIGSATEKTYNEKNEVLTTETFDDGEVYKTYFGIEPRINATYIINDQNSVKSSYNRTYQYIQLVQSSAAGDPNSVWLPSSLNIKPAIADQYSMGYFRNIFGGNYEFSIEGYYKTIENQIDLENGANILQNLDLEAQLAVGEGRAYGAEFLVRKNEGRLTGWVSYTLSKVERRAEGINNGEWYSARYDRTHDISVVVVYKLSEKWDFSANWVYNTGEAVTLPVGSYRIEGESVFQFGERNANRLPDYHRLDFGFNWKLTDESSGWESELNLSMYNAYGRRNAFRIFFAEGDVNSNEIQRIALFRFVPAITWNFKF